MNNCKKCKYCAKEFVPKRVGGRHKGLYCSRECFQDYVRSQLKVTRCKNCDVEFTVTHDKKTFCSKECFYESNKKENNPSWSGGKKNFKCVVCKSQFLRWPSIGGKTCSPECASQLAHNNSSGIKNGNWRGGKEVKCEVCSNLFWVCPSQSAKYCSKECFYKMQFQNRESKRWSQASKWGMKGTKSGTRPDLGIYVRSGWEANYARYLKWLVVKGKVLSWEYEADTFEFIGIKKGTRFYTPDFKVKLPDGSIEYHEVKGWQHPKGQTALKRMAKYHPNVKIVMVQKEEYATLKKVMSKVIAEWE